MRLREPPCVNSCDKTTSNLRDITNFNWVVLDKYAKRVEQIKIEGMAN